jgi:hypothetical protein
LVHRSQRKQYLRLRRLSALMATLNPDVDIIRRVCHGWLLFGGL